MMPWKSRFLVPLVFIQAHFSTAYLNQKSCILSDSCSAWKPTGYHSVRGSSYKKSARGDSEEDERPATSTRRKSGTVAKSNSKARGIAKQRKKSKEPSFWVHEDDKVRLVYGKDGDAKSLEFQVRGNPRPLVRHRTSRGFIYNPSADLQKTFQNLVEEKVFNADELPKPLFQGDACLVMSIVFRMKRPLKDFVGGKRDPSRLRDSAQPQTTLIRKDVDNLTKFVLDSMNEVLYHDDSQISSLHVTKLLDNDGLCEGSTEVSLQRMNEEDIETLIRNSFSILED